MKYQVEIEDNNKTAVEASLFFTFCVGIVFIFRIILGLADFPFAAFFYINSTIRTLTMSMNPDNFGRNSAPITN